MSSMVLWKYAIDPICKPPTKRHGIPPISTTELGHEVPQVPRFLCDEDDDAMSLRKLPLRSAVP
jgi:hypothetical protein